MNELCDKCNHRIAAHAAHIRHTYVNGINIRTELVSRDCAWCDCKY
jgi:hypothetical protein